MKVEHSTWQQPIDRIPRLDRELNRPQTDVGRDPSPPSKFDRVQEQQEQKQAERVQQEADSLKNESRWQDLKTGAHRKSVAVELVEVPGFETFTPPSSLIEKTQAISDAEFRPTESSSTFQENQETFEAPLRPLSSIHDDRRVSQEFVSVANLMIAAGGRVLA